MTFEVSDKIIKKPMINSTKKKVLYTVTQKISLLCLAITLIYVNRFR